MSQHRVFAPKIAVSFRRRAGCRRAGYLAPELHARPKRAGAEQQACGFVGPFLAQSLAAVFSGDRTRQPAFGNRQPGNVAAHLVEDFLLRLRTGEVRARVTDGVDEARHRIAEDDLARVGVVLAPDDGRPVDLEYIRMRGDRITLRSNLLRGE